MLHYGRGNRATNNTMYIGTREENAIISYSLHIKEFNGSRTHFTTKSCEPCNWLGPRFHWHQPEPSAADRRS